MTRLLHQLATGEWVDPDSVLAITPSPTAPGLYLTSGDVMWTALLTGETVQQGVERLATQINEVRSNPVA